MGEEKEMAEQAAMAADTASGMGLEHPFHPHLSGFDFLRWLIDYEVVGSRRYRRFVSLLIVEPCHEPRDLALLRETFRASDQIIRLDELSAAVLLRETDMGGTLRAVHRYETLNSSHPRPRFGIVSYPADSCNAAGLLRLARERIEQALRSNVGGSELWATAGGGELT